MKALALIVAIICFIVAVVYLLPAGPLGHHVKHAIIFAVLGVLALVWMRFAGASRAGAR